MTRAGDRAVVSYVAAQRALDSLLRQDAADVADYEYAVRQKRAVVKALYARLTGSQLGEARRRLAPNPQGAPEHSERSGV